MKSRQKFTVTEKNYAKKVDADTADSSLESRVKKKFNCNPLLLKNLNFLQTYNNLFRKPAYHTGDADTYFRQSLRGKHEPFDLIRDLNLGKHLVKSVKSLENIKRKQRSKRTLLSPRNLPKRHSYTDLCLESPDKLIVKELYTLDQDEESGSDAESEGKGYFSPPNELLADLEDVEEVSEEEKSSETPRVQTPQVESLRVESLRVESLRADTPRADTPRADTPRVDTPKVETPKEETSKRETFKEESLKEDSPREIFEQYKVTENQFTMESEEFGAEADDMPEGEDEMKTVGEMIDQAAEELEQVAADHQTIMASLKDQDTKAGGQGGDGSFFKFDPKIDAAVIKELEAAEKQAKETANIINELKSRVAELCKKEKMTAVEAKELEQKNKQLKAQMILFEEKTKRIQFLIAQSNLFEVMLPIKPPLQTKQPEDMLPKIILCGLGGQNMFAPEGGATCTPRFPTGGFGGAPGGFPPGPGGFSPGPGGFPPGGGFPPRGCPPGGMPPQSPPPQMSANPCMQKPPAGANSDSDGRRYKLQSDLLNRDQNADNLQRQLTNLQNQMRMVCQENALLNDKLKGGSASASSPLTSPNRGQTMSSCGKGKGICPADIEARLQEYSENTQNLEKQLGDMEEEVKKMQQEFSAVQREREHLEHHRKMLCVPPPCFPPPCGPPPPCFPPPPCGAPPPCHPPPCSPPPCYPMPCGMPPCMPRPPCAPPCGPTIEQQLKELREQYNRLQDDFKGKLTEVAGLRANNEKLKELTKAAEEAKKAAEEKVKELDNEIKKMKADSKGIGKGSFTKEQMIEQEQQLTVAKQRFREAQDELEELRALVEDQQGQLDDYRNKYLEAQQKVDEQIRQIDLMEMENQRASEEVNMEILRVKNQFQEKLQELMPLPDILKSTQVKLQEAQQMHLLAERNNEAMSRELALYKDKVAAMTSTMNEVRSDQQLGADEHATLKSRITELEASLKELQEENTSLKEQLEKMQERAEEAETLAESRLHEITQLESQVQTIREETARQVARVKDRCEIVRRSMQNQISDMERQLAQSRALAKAAQKDRDDIRQKMQAQINNLNENFEDAQMRIKNLQGHVNFLKNSYGDVFPSTGKDIKNDCANKKKNPPDPCCCGAEY